MWATWNNYRIENFMWCICFLSLQRSHLQYTERINYQDMPSSWLRTQRPGEFSPSLWFLSNCSSATTLKKASITALCKQGHLTFAQDSWLPQPNESDHPRRNTKHLLYLLKDKPECRRLANEKIVRNIRHLVKTPIQHPFINRSNFYYGL